MLYTPGVWTFAYAVVQEIRLRFAPSRLRFDHITANYARVKARLHDTTSCQTGLPDVKPGLTTRLSNRLYNWFDNRFYRVIFSHLPVSTLHSRFVIIQRQIYTCVVRVRYKSGTDSFNLCFLSSTFRRLTIHFYAVLQTIALVCTA